MIKITQMALIQSEGMMFNAGYSFHDLFLNNDEIAGVVVCGTESLFLEGRWRCMEIKRYPIAEGGNYEFKLVKITQ